MTLTVYEELEQGSHNWIESRDGLVTARTVRQLVSGAGEIADNDTARELGE